VNTNMPVVSFPTATLIDALLEPWQTALGADLPAYRNHAQRLFHLSCAFQQITTPEEERLIAVAAAFHDLAIWSHRTFDYLEPSAGLAEAWLEGQGDSGNTELVRAMIMEHHKIRAAAPGLVEAFRRADWTDVMQGHLRFGLEATVYRQLRQQYPFLGFHALLLRLGARQLRRHPLQPLPMLRW
jgi:hypothetical protein